jgi:hypothetical protein
VSDGSREPVEVVLLATGLASATIVDETQLRQSTARSATAAQLSQPASSSSASGST